MKIEAEVHNSLYSFADVKCGGGGGTGRAGGCSVAALDLSPTAQERASIDRPERQLGCGSSTRPADDQNNGIPLATSAFDCEHFQFIDEEEDDFSDDIGDRNRLAGDGDDGSAPAPDEGLRECGGLLPQPEVSASPVGVVVVELQPPAEHTCPPGPDDVMSEKAVKRQVSFDDAATTGGGQSTAKKELKSLLKKGSRSSKRRVTFNEAVSLYSDEHEGIRLLQLTTGPDIICTDAFYMFEPPIEYQDVPPFEPPAEYRDQDDDDTPTPPSEPAIEDDPSDVVQKNGPSDGTTTDSVTVSIVAEENLNGQQTMGQQQKEKVSRDAVVTKETTSNAKQVKTVETVSNQMQTESAKESDKLFERFLEAEREFAVDEELNNVFHELEGDFANDGENGALDDNFFRKLITLLSNAEGDAPLEDSDFLSSTKFANTGDDLCQDVEDDDNSQTHSRTLSEADSDCSISSQDTIIVRLGEDENEHNSNIVNNKPLARPKDTEFEQKFSPDKEDVTMLEKQEVFDEVFSNEESPRPLPRESLVMKNMQMHQAAVKLDKTNEESLSRQSSGEQSVNSGTSQDPPQDADDSTSSDSRSGEVEEEIRLDDIGYDEEDADDYDEESFRGMARGNSKIRRIIKKNALQCTLFKGIEAKRRQQPGAKYPRPKSPLLSQESLVEKLKWLTTVDDQKDTDPLNFHSKPPDVILSTGEIPMNGSIPHNASSEDEIHNRTAMAYQQQQQFYQMQRFAMPPNSKGGYYVRQDGYHASLPRQRMSCPGHPPQMSTHNMAYAPARMVAHPGNSQQWSEQRNMTVPRNFRDWRVIQRVMVSRNGDGSRSPQIPADYVRCANGTFSPPNVPPDVSRTSQGLPRGHKDELEQFVEQDSKRLDKLRKRYSLAEEETDDPTFGFARRPSVRGVQTRIQPNPSDTASCHKLDYSIYEEGSQGQHMVQTRAAYAIDQMRVWNRDPNWRPENSMVQYGPIGPGGVRPMHIHRASVALTELPGCATIPYAHRKPHPDPRYHSYAESMYGSTRTLPTKGWDPRSCHHNVSNPAMAVSHQSLQNNPGSYQNSPSAASHQMVSPQMLQVPPKGDERGAPEGASSSPKISSDSLYHAPVVPDSGGQHKDEGVIYYSLNV